MTMVPNKIEKQIHIKAPRSRVWKAITDAKEFGTWFGVRLEGQFAPNTEIKGKMTNKPSEHSNVDNFDHVVFKMTVQKIEPEHLFSYTWIPYGIEKGVDYSKEEPTLVEFVLEEKDGGTFLKITESGFDHVPLARRAKAFEMDSMGWGIQIERIQKYSENAGK